MIWRRFNGEKLQEKIVDEVDKVIHRERALGHKLKICIGTDSQVKNNHVEFATVIVFLREKKGGFMFIANYNMPSGMGLKERMITEVAKSIEIAYALCDVMERHGVELEVHADINTDPSFKSNVALKEAMGYILGMGFVFKAKPEAFASSACADKVV